MLDKDFVYQKAQKNKVPEAVLNSEQNGKLHFSRSINHKIHRQNTRKIEK